jgi:hypothetical protein
MTARRTFSVAALAALVSACGGGGPLGNPPIVSNPPATGNGQKLSFVYFQKCVQPILLAPLPVTQNGVTAINTCAASGCHDNVAGTGGALRVVPGATEVDLANPANTPDVIRTTDMYRNFYSSQGEVVLGSALQSRLIAKPLLLGVLHGGGLVFHSVDDPMVKILRYWIEHPMPTGQDEFSVAGNQLFTPADPATGTCNTD